MISSNVGQDMGQKAAIKPQVPPPPGGWGGRNPPPPQWAKGTTGNPFGHPKGQKNYRANFKKLLNEVAEYKAPIETVKLIRAHFPDAPEDMQVQMAEALRLHVAMLNGESWAYSQVHGKELSLELNGNMTVGLHDISDDELQRRLEDIARRDAIACDGEATPEMPK